MKSIGTLILAGVILLACNNNNNRSSSETKSNDSQIQSTDESNTIPEKINYIGKIVENYLELKNALAQDNSEGAANAGKALETAIKNLDKSSFTDAQKKSFKDVEEDAREHAEHIGKNGGNIKHQREHFEILSQDIYDLVKTFGAGQVLYKDFCQMYNDGKGALWLSETKEIKNPYYGKSMLTCGTIQEELQ